MYRSIDASAIVSTIEQLHRRILERFPDSGLAGVAVELLDTARAAQTRVEEIRRPHVPLRIGVGLLILLIVGVLGGTFLTFEFSAEGLKLVDVVSVTEAALNELVLIGALILFLVTLERRWRRNQALRWIHELRSLAHVVDMHQLTKDPQHATHPGGSGDTASSPKRTLTPFLLSRYLDYCSEMFSLIGKVAALYVQDLDDATVITSVNDVDQLTTGLSRKVWQKIIILHSLESGGTPLTPGPADAQEA